MIKNPGKLLRATAPVSVVLAFIAGCGGGGFDIKDYLEVECEGSALQLDSSNFEIDLSKDRIVELDGFRLKSEGQGRLRIETPELEDKRTAVILDSSKVVLPVEGVDYEVSSSQGEAESTLVSVSRSCERE